MVGGPLQVCPIGLALALAPVAPDAADSTDPPRGLGWEVPAECPNASALQLDVERLLGRTVDGEDLEPLGVHGRIRRRGSAWHLRLEIGGARAKELEAPRCETLAEVAALYVALAIDPTAMLGADVHTQGEVSRDYAGAIELAWPEEPRAQPGPVARAISTKTRANKGPRIGARFIAGASGFLLQGAAAGVGAALAVMLPRARFEALGSYFLPREVEHEEQAGVGARLQLGAAALRACPVLRAQRWEFPLCAGVEVGAMVAHGVGVEDARVQRSLWAAVTAGPAAAWQPVRAIALWAQVDAVVLLVRPGFGVEGLGSLFRAPPAGLQAFLGLEARFR